MPTYNIKVNKKNYEINAESDMPLLWVLRDLLDLNGTKYSCGIGQCGACTVHIDGVPLRSCMLPIGEIGQKSIKTIEGVAKNNKLHPVQQAWVEADVPQCGYCQSGQIMSAVALIESDETINEQSINKYMDGHLCRCGTYQRVKKAIIRAKELSNE
jgi:aerobic-type carbon monoxide dehydrogenase small subunit (CoxS/CutS family)